MKYYKVKVFAYVEPVRLNPVNLSAHWYKEGKIFPTNDPCKVVALVGGYRMSYNVKMYLFRKVRASIPALQRLFNYLEKNKSKYPGWLHHANVYEGDIFIKQIKLS